MMKYIDKAPTLCDIKEHENQWMRVKDFFYKDFLLPQVCRIDKIPGSKASITVLDNRAILACDSMRDTEKCMTHQEVLLTLTTFDELLKFMECNDQYLFNKSARFPNTKEEKLNYYVFSIKFAKAVKIDENQLSYYLPSENDNWRLYGRKYADGIFVDAIYSKFLFRDSSLFCTDEDLLEEDTNQ